MTATPPGNSLESRQQGRVVDPGSDPLDGLEALLERTRSEIEYSAAKGDGLYRLGMHDGLRYAEDAIVALLEAFGRSPEKIDRDRDA
jgi:hypothetical protein